MSDKYLKIAAGINPDWPEPFLYMGLNAYAQGDMKVAEEMLRKAILLDGKRRIALQLSDSTGLCRSGPHSGEFGTKSESEVYLAKARELQNKTMEQTQQSVSAMALAGGAGAAAAIVPLSKQDEDEAAPVLETNTDPFARVDASMLARANLSSKQRASADWQEKNLRLILGASLNDLATAEAVQRDMLPRSVTIRRPSAGTQISRVWARILEFAPSV